ncbi:MAG: TIM barrel protein, partial [Promethearchaeota archaeon]
ICLCPETMGKHGQLGTVDEVIEICKTIGLDKCRPCIDFGHIYARNLGKLTGTKLFEKTFNAIESELGKDIVENLHIHYSKIEYTPKGEKKHYPNTTKEWGPEIDPLFKLCIENGYKPIIINESPDLDPDAQILMKKWKSRNKD